MVGLLNNSRNNECGHLVMKGGARARAKKGGSLCNKTYAHAPSLRRSKTYENKVNFIFKKSASKGKKAQSSPPPSIPPPTQPPSREPLPPGLPSHLTPPQSDPRGGMGAAGWIATPLVAPVLPRGAARLVANTHGRRRGAAGPVVVPSWEGVSVSSPRGGGGSGSYLPRIGGN